MKRYSKTWFLIAVILICTNLLLNAYFRLFSGVVAWSLVLFAEFQIRSYDKEIDELRKWADYWYKIATGKERKLK